MANIQGENYYFRNVKDVIQMLIAALVNGIVSEDKVKIVLIKFDGSEEQVWSE